LSGPTVKEPSTVLALGACAPLQEARNRTKLLLVSFDGFRWNYDQDVDTPNLDTMASEGVKARYMTPAFVTQTSPCHFTLVLNWQKFHNQDTPCLLHGP
uniref:Ectonucleotide pyrophosphatase/phosphodiesterase 7 n=1 Tax=Varanus komodoensis TaxID=61221 RepID=A0A8D2LRV9_VARKO